MPKKSFLPKLLASIVICESAGIVGSLFTFSSISTWYNTLNKPSFSPPNFLFGPVWIILYALMGISLYLVWQKGLGKKEIKTAITLFGIHLVVNALWSIIFFGLKSPSLAFLVIIILWTMIVAVIYKFWKIDKRAGFILLPYLIWVSFAAVLNYSVWQLNI